MTVASTAEVPTAYAHQDLQQLCKDWAHSLPVEHDEASGRITFPRDARGADWPGDAVTLLAAEHDILRCRIEASAEGQLAGLESALALHLERFAFWEASLPVGWKEN